MMGRGLSGAGCNSLSRISIGDGTKLAVSLFNGGDSLVFDVNGLQLQVKPEGIYFVDAVATPTMIWGIYPR